MERERERVIGGEGVEETERGKEFKEALGFRGHFKAYK